MNKKVQLAYVSAFLLICAAPLACMPFFKSDENAENRKLSEMPSLVSDGSINTSWGTEFETYFSEHFAFRSSLVTLDSLIKSKVFKTSSSDKVIVGSDGWLYYAETLPDYTGANAMSERKLYRTAKTLALMQEHFEADGRSFLFFCAPNKNSVYPEQMPARYVKSSAPSNLERLPRWLDECGVNHLELLPLFRESDKRLYLTRDSHWTNEGALIAYNAAADALGLEHDDLSSCPHHTETVWHADLDGMLFPSYEVLSDQEIFEKEFTFEYSGIFTGEDDILIKTRSGSSGGNLLMYRDSFGRAFYPYAAENAEKACFSRETPYRTSLADDIDAECVILEIVERNLEKLTSSAPYMTSPSRAMNFSSSVKKSEENSCTTSLKNNTLRIYGSLDPVYFADDSDIFVTLETDGAIYGFEAFPIFEAELLEADSDSDFGYSVSIDTTAIPPANYEVYAYVKTGDKYICTAPLAEITIGE